MRPMGKPHIRVFPKAQIEVIPLSAPLNITGGVVGAVVGELETAYYVQIGGWLLRERVLGWAKQKVA